MDPNTDDTISRCMQSVTHNRAHVINTCVCCCLSHAELVLLTRRFQNGTDTRRWTRKSAGKNWRPVWPDTVHPPPEVSWSQNRRRKSRPFSLNPESPMSNVYTLLSRNPVIKIIYIYMFVVYFHQLLSACKPKSWSKYIFGILGNFSSFQCFLV